MDFRSLAKLRDSENTIWDVSLSIDISADLQDPRVRGGPTNRDDVLRSHSSGAGMTDSKDFEAVHRKMGYSSKTVGGEP